MWCMPPDCAALCHPPDCGAAYTLRDKPRLTDADIPHYEQQPRVPSKRPLQTGQLALTADKAGHRSGHPASPPAPAGRTRWRRIHDLRPAAPGR
jgi:hypothetical protein